MKGFPGFPDGKLRTVPVPEPFFTDLLPLIDHLGELKVTLHGMWCLSLKAGHYRFLQRADFAEDELFMRGLSASPRQAEAALDDALERAETRGTLLRVVVEDSQAERALYFLNTPRGREAVEKLTQGEWRPESFDGAVFRLSQMRSTIFTLYEQNIGPLTPMISEELRDLADTYPQAWIEDAIRVAVKNNVRRLKYIQAILNRMSAEGRYEQETPDTAEEILRNYQEYLPYIENEPSADPGSGDDTNTD